MQQVPITPDYASGWRREPGIGRQAAIFTLKFAGALAVTSLICTAVWGTWVTERLYHCTDSVSVGLDYLAGPTHWVHGAVAGEVGDFGDTIKPGWTFFGLKCLWYGLIGASLVLSLVVAWVPWCLKRRGVRRTP